MVSVPPETLAAGHGIQAWGSNISGVLGNGTTVQSNVPASVQDLGDALALSAGAFHSLALKSDGTVWAWGFNGGRLGNGTGVESHVPVMASGLGGVVAIAAGDIHSLALKSDGTVWAWGSNLGDGTNGSSTVPVQVSALSGVAAIAAGGLHSLAVKSDGTVRAWGANDFGQLGNGTTTSSNVPVQVSGLSGVIEVAADDHHSLALKSDGTVWAWGDNSSGALGNGTSIDSPVPVQVSGFGPLNGGATAVAAGTSHSMALKSDGTVWTWGNNGNGQLGIGTSLDHRELPVMVPGLGGVVAIAAGDSHSLAVKSDGTARTWGYNGFGELGNGSTTQSTVPVTVSNLNTALAVAGGGRHSLALVGTRAGLTPATLNFGTVAVGATSDVQTVTFTNQGPGALSLSSQNLSGFHPDDFLLSPQNLPATLNDGDSLALSLRFHPTAGGARNAQLSIVSTAIGSPHAVSLTGTGNPSADLGLSLTAAGLLGLPNLVLLEGDITYNITVSNTGPATSYDVQVRDGIRQGTVYLRSSSSQGSCALANAMLSCALGSVAKGATARVTLVVKNKLPLGLGQLTNTATVSPGASSPDPNSANDSASVIVNGI
jgi:uncharacterized repeat protein (TIGR01451 family)